MIQCTKAFDKVRHGELFEVTGELFEVTGELDLNGKDLEIIRILNWEVTVRGYNLCKLRFVNYENDER